MTLVLNGTTGVSAVDGSASTPAIQGNDTNTGVFFPAADTVAVATGGTERVRVDSSGNVGIGTSSPGYKLTVNGRISYSGAIGEGADTTLSSASTTVILGESATWTALSFRTGGSERARIDSSGNLLVNKTSTGYVNGNNLSFELGAGTAVFGHVNGGGTANDYCAFIYNTSRIGGIVQNGASAVSYATSSDYRLKEDIAPMTGALAKVSALKPVTYKWKVDGSDGQGFIAHELQAVVPDAVTGSKDAVDADGNPQYQGIDTSFLVATLTAAIQELTARVQALETK